MSALSEPEAQAQAQPQAENESKRYIFTEETVALFGMNNIVVKYLVYDKNTEGNDENLSFAITFGDKFIMCNNNQLEIIESNNQTKQPRLKKKKALIEEREKLQQEEFRRLTKSNPEDGVAPEAAPAPEAASQNKGTSE